MEDKSYLHAVWSDAFLKMEAWKNPSVFWNQQIQEVILQTKIEAVQKIIEIQKFIFQTQEK